MTEARMVGFFNPDENGGEEIRRPMNEEELAQDALDIADDNEFAAQIFRDLRNARLAETDWWVLPDRTPTDEQLAYRQALRDLPANTTDPANPVWPTKPE